MAVFKCKMCGATLHVGAGQSTAECEYCGTTQTLPKLDDERRAQMYDRANHFRRNNEFDKAMGIYEQILNEDSTDAEAYWSLVLCRYGIEYVEDPATHRRMPTINRTQFTSIFDDEDYKSALAHADEAQKAVYRAEAETINEIQKGILAISQKEEPFDVFICYKETDDSGRRTPDSVLANELYHELTRAGFKVFFARITLEDKLGTAYEPYIFAALNSARVMVVIGTKPAYFNAVWVKNEWSRYLALMRNEKNGTKNGISRVLIPAYRDMDPYDLPEEFSHLQAQDMSKLGFMQDLIRGIRKILGKEEANGGKAGGSAASGILTAEQQKENTIAPLLKRAFLFLEDGAWEEADEYCEKVLDLDPENARAYLGKLMASKHCHHEAELGDCTDLEENDVNYQKTLRFGGAELGEQLKELLEQARKSSIYAKAQVEERENSVRSLNKAIGIYEQIPDWKDAQQRVQQCREKIEDLRCSPIYEQAQKEERLDSMESLTRAIERYERIENWRDVKERLRHCRERLEERKQEAEQTKKRKRKRNIILALCAAVAAVIFAFVLVLNTVLIPSYHYHRGETLREAGDNMGALAAFQKAGNYEDAREALTDLINQIYMPTIAAKYHTVGLKSDGTVVAVGDNNYGECDVSDWTDIVAVSAGWYHTVGLKSDGTVVATGFNRDGQCDVSDWTDIVAVAAGQWHTVGLKSDGTVVAAGNNDAGQCDVSDWVDIVAVSAGNNHTVGLKSDGTVVATGSNSYGRCDVSDWVDIVAVAAGDHHTVGLKSDGTVVATGDNDAGQCDVSGWKDIVAVAAGDVHTVGLKSDGTVVAAGHNHRGQCDVSGWTDIVAVAAGGYHTVGLKSDGTVVATGDNGSGRCDVSDWTDIGPRA